MNKAARQRHILELIRQREVHTQHELASLLEAEGIEATQVTLSRDVHELGLIKGPRGYQKGLSPNAAPSIFQQFFVTAEAAQNLVVIRTTPGNAMTVARAIDEERWPEIIGTVAGDDTILAVTARKADADAVTKKLLERKS
jgi:transcriptional regulator of arginine metabolism